MPISLTTNVLSYHFPFFLKLYLPRRKVHFLSLFSKHREEKNIVSPIKWFSYVCTGLAQPSLSQTKTSKAEMRDPLVGTAGIHYWLQTRYRYQPNTSLWYTPYQTVVVLVPSCGSPRTKLWYFEYQTVVFWIPTVGISHLLRRRKPYIYLPLPIYKAWE